MIWDLCCSDLALVLGELLLTGFETGQVPLEGAEPCAHLAPHGSSILSLHKWVGKSLCQRGLGTVAAVQRKASGHSAFLLGAGRDFFVL